MNGECCGTWGGVAVAHGGGVLWHMGGGGCCGTLGENKPWELTASALPRSEKSANPVSAQ